jgi:ADP-heptose:LPS heptosyltransferase
MKTAILKTIDSTMGAWICRLIGWFSAPPDPASFPAEPSAPGRILVIRPGGIGDMLMLLPVLRRITDVYPGAELKVLCEGRNAGVLALAGMRAAALLYDTHPFQLLAYLMRNKFDIVLDSEQFHCFSAIFGYLSRAAIRVGYKINPVRNPLYTHLVDYAPDGPEGLQFLKLLEPLHIPQAPYQLAGILKKCGDPLPPDLEKWLATCGSARQIITLHVGGSSPHKQWPVDKYARLVEDLAGRFKPCVLLLGNENDTRREKELKKLLSGTDLPVWITAGTLSLSQTATLIQRAKLLIGPDSGLVHLGITVNTPTVALYGATDHRKWACEGPANRVVRNPLPCSPCCIFGYHKPCRTYACMHGISVEEVGKACAEIISAP